MANLSDVFISYRRADVDFTKKIDEALKASGREVWVDWEDIPPGVEGFTDEIQQGIEGANAFLAILSPSYLESEYCLMELREALRLKKRVIPIVLQKFEPVPAPEGIGHINWIYFVPHAGQENTFEESFPRIVQALEADNEHTRTHTRILMRAIEWGKGNKHPSYLLKGEELSSAETWQVSAVEKNPPLNELQSQYILASRAQQTKQQRQIMVMIAAFLVLAGVAAIFAVFQAIEAKRQEGIAQEQAVTAVAAQANAEEQRAIAVDAQANAETQAEIAQTARADAVGQAEIAQTAQANSQAQAEIAQTAQANAEEQRGIAVDAQSDAETQAEIAQTARADAVGQAEIAQTAQANSEKQAEIAQAAQASAEEQRSIAVEAESEAERQAVEANSLALSASALSAGNENIAVALALEAVRIEEPPHEVVYNLFNVAYQPGIRYRFPYIDRSIAENLSFFTNPAVSPDGKTILIRNTLMDIETGELIRVFEGAPNLVLSSAFTPDGTKVVLAGDIDPFASQESMTELLANPMYLGIWDVATGQLLQTLDTGAGVSYVQVGEDGLRLASFLADDHFLIWDMTTGQRIGEYSGYDHASLNSDLRLMAHQKTVQGFNDGSFFYTVEVLNIRNDLEIFTIGFPSFASNISIKFDNTSTVLAIITDNYLSLVDMNTAYMYSLAGHSARITSVGFSQNEVVTAGEDQQINVWNRASGELMQTFNGHDISVIFADFRNESQIVSLDLSGNVVLWDMYAGDLIQELPNTEVQTYGTQLKYNADRTRAVYEIHEADGSGTLVMLNMSSGAELGRFTIPDMDTLTQVFFLPDGNNLLLVNYTEPYKAQLLRLNLSRGQLTTLYQAESIIVDLSPDGQTILVANYGYTDFNTSRIINFNLSDMSENFSLSVIPDGAYFLDDGLRFISTEYPNNAAWSVTYNLRDAQTGALIRTITTDAPPIDSLALTTDEQYLITSASRSNQDTIQTNSGIALRYGINFSYVNLWNFQTGTLIRDFVTEGGTIALSEDERTFTVTDNDSIRLWRLDSLEELIRWTCQNRYVAQFTAEQRERFGIISEENLCSTLGRRN